MLKQKGGGLGSSWCVETEFMGYSVEFSPFDGQLVAVSSAENFGIVGQGQQAVWKLSSSAPPKIVARHRAKDGVYDCAWSEVERTQMVFAVGDGSVTVWDWAQDRVVRAYQEHTQEVYSVDWNPVGKSCFLSGSWDMTAKLYDPRESRSLRTFVHKACVYNVCWHPKHTDMFASVAGDGCLYLFDANDKRPAQVIQAHKYEALCCDWNKYNEFEVVTGSVDNTIRVWDTRKPSSPTKTLTGHEFAVRRVKCSPHNERELISASYDMSLAVWDIGKNTENMVHQYDQHTEFVVGLSYNLFVEGQIASCSWDQRVCIFPIGGKPEYR